MLFTKMFLFYLLIGSAGFSILVLKNELFLEFIKIPLSFTFSFDMAFSLALDNVYSYFFFMVCLVVMVVVLYSKMYMSHYPPEKFLLLAVLFSFSMFILISSGSYVILMTGWDYLGITSLFLIMFYPNKTSQVNSFITFFFNRMGDALMIFFIVFCFRYSSSIVDSGWGVSSMFTFIILGLCSLTKSAQFPLSSWLPAAMSAPTPISAMVHSSTLVTAGVYLLSKFNFYFFLFSFDKFFFFNSLLTLLLGGLLANLEIDFKKIVAFSTLSQISIMIFFNSVLMYSYMVSHMFFHALFKTSLFCCCGLIFMNMFSNQNFMSGKLYGKEGSFASHILLSVFMMTGLMFSSSFFSKDLVLEVFESESSSFIFLAFFLGAILTLFYCSSILTIFKNRFSFYKIWTLNANKTYFLLFLNMISFLGIFIFLNTQNMDHVVEIFSLEVKMLSFFVASFSFLFVMKKFFLFLPVEVGLMKFFTLSSFSLVPLNFTGFNDQKFFGQFFSSRKSTKENNKFGGTFIYMVIFFMFL